MRKHNVFQSLKSFRFIFLEPENLWSSKTRKHQIAEQLNNLLVPASFLSNLVTLFSSCSITPELNVVQSFAVCSKRNKTMLLTRDTNSLNSLFIFSRKFSKTNFKSLVEPFSLLLACSICLRNQLHRAACFFNNLFLFVVVNYNLHTLCTKVNSSNSFHNVLYTPFFGFPSFHSGRLLHPSLTLTVLALVVSIRPFGPLNHQRCGRLLRRGSIA